MITCRSCPYFVLTNVQQGECHAGPPTCFALGGQQGVTGAMGIFPPVKPDSSWCGKHPDGWRIPALRVAAARAQAPGNGADGPEVEPMKPPLIVS
jgi:hypothetical protein